MKIQLLNQIGYRPPLSPKHEKCLFFEDAKPDTFWLNARDSQVKDEVKSRVVVGWLLFHKSIYVMKSCVAAQHCEIFHRQNTVRNLA